MNSKMQKVSGDTQKKNADIADIIFFGVLLVVASAVTLILFYKQAALGSPEGGYHSDIKAYMQEMQGLDSGYNFPYPVYFKLGALLHLFMSPELAMALATMLLNSLGMVFLKLCCNRLVKEQLQEAFSDRKWMAGMLISLVTVSLFFVSMLFPPAGMYLPGIKFKYLGVFTPNPFHNATYMAARPFGILAFFWFAKLLPLYEKGPKAVSKSDYIGFAVTLLLATMTKPSFTIVLVGTAGLIMLFRMLKSKFRNFLPTILLGCCFLPTFADLLYQFQGVFVPEEGAEGGMGFCMGTIWRQYCDNMPLGICLAIGFPLLVLVLNYKELKENHLYRFSWQIYGMSFLMAFFLYEKGFRANDFNFSWGYMYGIFFAFVGALSVLLQATAKKKKPLLLGVQWLAYLWHIACGIYYFYGIFQGGMYY